MPIAHHRLRLGTILCLLCCASTLPADVVRYQRDVKPILKARCYACHGSLKQESGLRLDTGALVRAGGDSGAAVEANRPDESLLIERISAADPGARMPPEGQALTPEQIERFRLWIADGAESPPDEEPEADPGEHWAFQPPAPAGVPESLFGDPALPDAPAAARHVLLRRLYLDLIGLPPTRAELNRFLDDRSPDAVHRVVERLLGDPRYGERWARHWMDIWRYSDWYGRRHVPDVWNSAPQVWRWRDWIVRSLNQDKGYDQMIREMLAADEIDPTNPDAAVATGYLVRNWYALNPNDWMRNTVEHTGKAFLGLTFNCAHCHDHKYDPISHRDYFRLRAFFEPMHVRQDRVAGEADPGPFQEYEYSKLRKVQQLGAVRVFDKTLDAPTWFYTGGDERNRLADLGSIPPGVPAFLAAGFPSIEQVELPARAWYPGLNPAIEQTVLQDAKTDVAAAVTAVETAQDSIPTVAAAAQQRLAEADAAYQSALAGAGQDGMTAAIAGTQSLVLDASGGRRIVNNRINHWNRFPERTSIEFDLLLGTDANFNFQLAKDADKGLTATYVAFDKGRIVSYRPRSTTEFDVGKYDFAAGQRRFHVLLSLFAADDLCRLTIRSITDGSVLVEDAEVALNGWNPLGDPTKAITLDAQTGSIAMVDELILKAAPAESDQSWEVIASFGFEPPDYRANADVVGIGGWERSSFSADPATSIVASSINHPELISLAKAREAARRAVDRPSLHVQTAQARLAAAQAIQASVEARIAADQARYGERAVDDVSAVARQACRLEYEASLRTAEAELLASEYALAQAEAKPAGDKQRNTEIEAATKRFGIARDKLPAIQAAAPASSCESYTPLSPTYPRTSTGRRRALASWITSRENPLTARVAVNHIWSRHFHRPLVATAENFGRNGAKPTDASLLDWLAVEFVKSGWSMKHLHRLILTSPAFQQASVALGSDPAPARASENLHPVYVGRMEAEVIRDSLLSLGNQLQDTIGGQPLDNQSSLTTYRRSLYYEVYPEEGGASALSSLFDAPDPLECYRRTRSIVPQQALALTNSDLVHAVGKRLVAGWSQRYPQGTDEAFISHMFESILSRRASPQERRLCRSALLQQRKLADTRNGSDQSMVARESLVRVLLNHNDFVTIR